MPAEPNTHKEKVPPIKNGVQPTHDAFCTLCYSRLWHSTICNCKVQDILVDNFRGRILEVALILCYADRGRACRPFLSILPHHPDRGLPDYLRSRQS